MPKKPFVIEYKKSRKISYEIDVVFTPEPKIELIQKIPAGYAIGISPEPTAKRKSKIDYNNSWRL